MTRQDPFANTVPTLRLSDDFLAKLQDKAPHTRIIRLGTPYYHDSITGTTLLAHVMKLSTASISLESYADSMAQRGNFFESEQLEADIIEELATLINKFGIDYIGIMKIYADPVMNPKTFQVMGNLHAMLGIEQKFSVAGIPGFILSPGVE